MLRFFTATAILLISFGLRAADMSIKMESLRFGEYTRNSYCRVEIAGRPLWFLIDTGSTFTDLFSNESKPDWLPADNVQPWSHWSEAGRVRGFKFQNVPARFPLFGSDLRNVELCVFPGKEYQLSTSLGSGTDISGVVGMDVIGASALRLRLRLPQLDTGPTSMEGLTDQWQPLRFHQKCPVTSVIIGNRKFEDFIIDTGSFTTAGLTKSLTDRLIRSGLAIVENQVDTHTIYGARKVRVIRLRQFEWHGLAFENLIAFESHANHVGLSMLERFDIALDFPGRRCRIVSVPGGEQYDPRPDAAGVKFSPKTVAGGGFAVMTLEPARPGVKAGLRVGDVVTAVDDKPCQDMRHSGYVYSLLRDSGRTCRVSILRDGQPQMVEIVLEWNRPWPPVWPDLPEQAPLLPDDPPLPAGR